MRYFNDFNIPLSKKTSFTIGKFDGFHLGHRKLIENVKKQCLEQEMESVVFSFFPLPSEAITGEPAQMIFTKEEKRAILENMGIDIFIEYPFTKEFAHMEPEKFVEKVLFEKLNCGYIAIGSDYRFGKDRLGSGELLKSLAEGRNIKVDIVGDILFNDEKISSTKTKKYILQNDFDSVKMLIDMHYYIVGNVVGGKRIGRKIGFPTVNLIPDKRKLTPSDGVYLTKTYHKGIAYNSITNIGINPTVAGDTRTVETHILDFSKDIYGEEIKVEFLKRIRDTLKFHSVSELREQINKDIANLRRVEL